MARILDDKEKLRQEFAAKEEAFFERWGMDDKTKKECPYHGVFMGFRCNECVIAEEKSNQEVWQSINDDRP